MKGEIKFIMGTIIVSLIFIVGAYFLLSGQKTPGVPKGEIIAENGIHWHPNLKITIEGKEIGLEDGIGLGAIHQPMHTHTEDYKNGVVHMEMQGLVTKKDTKLGNFFEIWGKKFTSTQVFDKMISPAAKVEILVNNKENMDFENYLMKDGDKIEIRYE